MNPPAANRNLRGAAKLIHESRHRVDSTGAGIFILSGSPNLLSDVNRIRQKNDPVQVASQSAPISTLTILRLATNPQTISLTTPNHDNSNFAALQAPRKVASFVNQNMDTLQQQDVSKDLLLIPGTHKNGSVCTFAKLFLPNNLWLVSCNGIFCQAARIAAAI